MTDGELKIELIMVRVIVSNSKSKVGSTSSCWSASSASGGCGWTDRMTKQERS